MSIERAIHDRWATDAALSSLLPAARVFTGTAEGNPRLPYAVLARVDTTPVLRTSSGTRLDDVRFELTIWAERLAAGQRIASAVARRFERATFGLAEGCVLVMRQLHHDERCEPHGAWRITLTFVVMHETTDSGVTTHV
ncbi:MAG: DUF3168 domain-containing protein [Planctomycetia bacterium]|nr:DUF3168 domain-containing protein [Planctomycetia bacterium]